MSVLCILVIVIGLMILNNLVILLIEGSVRIFVVSVGLIFLLSSIVWKVLVICIGRDSG